MTDEARPQPWRPRFNHFSEIALLQCRREHSKLLAKIGLTLSSGMITGMLMMLASVVVGRDSPAAAELDHE